MKKKCFLIYDKLLPGFLSFDIKVFNVGIYSSISNDFHWYRLKVLSRVGIYNFEFEFSSPFDNNSFISYVENICMELME